MTLKLVEDILRAAEASGIDPYRTPFKPSDLGLSAQDYGSFSDYCADTESAQYNSHICLKAVEFRRDGKPLRYILLKKGERL